ncbi:hypothetical protein ACHAXS_001957 [Conticribra weissflogii]
MRYSLMYSTAFAVVAVLRRAGIDIFMVIKNIF